MLIHTRQSSFDENSCCIGRKAAVFLSKTTENVPLMSPVCKRVLCWRLTQFIISQWVLNGFEQGYARRGQPTSSYRSCFMFLVWEASKFLSLSSDCARLCGKPLHVPLLTGHVCSRSHNTQCPFWKGDLDTSFFFFPRSPKKRGFTSSKRGLCSGGGIEAANNRSNFKTGIWKWGFSRFDKKGPYQPDEKKGFGIGWKKNQDVRAIWSFLETGKTL